MIGRPAFNWETNKIIIFWKYTEEMEQEMSKTEQRKNEVKERVVRESVRNHWFLKQRVQVNLFIMNACIFISNTNIYYMTRKIIQT